MDDPASYFLMFLAGEIEPASSLGMIALKLGAVLFLVAVNGYFVGAEFALVSVRRQRLEARVAAGSRHAASALRLLNDPTLFINASQLGITIASLALGWIGESTFVAILHPVISGFAPEGRAAYIAHLLAITFAFAMITSPESAPDVGFLSAMFSSEIYF